MIRNVIKTFRNIIQNAKKYYLEPRYKVPVKCSENAEEVGDKKTI